MANENVIKNMANEITRNCQTLNLTIDAEFVIFTVELLLLNPKYGKLFTKTISRNSLEYFVNECVSMLTCGDISTNTLRMQFQMQSNYDKLQNLIDKHLDSIDRCLRPLVNEILDEDPDDDEEYKKMFRKISIFIILSSGLGNPGVIATLKEGMAALESVFSLDDLHVFVALPRSEKLAQLNHLVQVVSGVRLFNRDCKKGGEGIPDLPFNVVEAGKACVSSLSNSLISVMQRVNCLTTAVEHAVIVRDDAIVIIDVPPESGLNEKDYKHIFDLLTFNRQYEVYIRKLLSDAETMVHNGTQCVERVRLVLEELHSTVKYKAAVPIVTVFPLFTKLWQVWRTMQNVMYLVSTVNRLMSALVSIQDPVKIPYNILEKMLQGKQVVSDQDRMSGRISMEERLSLGSLKNYVAYNDSFGSLKERHVQFLGFCALCLTVGALVPSNMKVGLIKCRGARYSFCSVKMAARFSRDPLRYVNEVLEFARNNPHIINLLNIADEVDRVRSVDNLVARVVPKTKICDKVVQTDIHPIESYIEKDYTPDLWELKRRACKWASVVNCRTHSTQTRYSHLRADTQCQTVEPRDKGLQTRRDAGVNTAPNNTYIWGLRGQRGDGQRTVRLVVEDGQKMKAHKVDVCTWPCTTSEN